MGDVCPGRARVGDGRVRLGSNFFYDLLVKPKFKMDVF